ncbi:MAG: insulinase family protein [Treponema sp.]|nr:insulinase family protein [Treponema sp.]
MISKSYKGFDLISAQDIPDCSSKGIYLRHRQTGLEVFHLLNDDKENLFAFAFRTPNNKSNGAAHIVEHSVFCGSKKYPLKDPFAVLENQSVQSFMNALTFPDKTVYPASSILEADYFNLMSVYADAVFFPTLSRQTFLQEGRRLELDSKGRPKIVGVVFNEMKGAYSSFAGAVGDAIDRALVPDTIYAKDSGGDPLEVATLTYEEFKDFHKKYYSPQNCLIFLYGNIPTEKQLDFLQKNVLDCFAGAAAFGAKNQSGAAFGAKNRSAFNSAEQKKFLEETLRSQTQKPFSKMRTLYEIGPVSAGDKDSSALLSWLWGNSDNMEDYVEGVYLGNLLSAQDGSPLSKALLKSGLGKDLSVANGIDASERQITFSVGLRGVKKQNVPKVKDFIIEEIKRVYDEGISQDDIESTINSIDFDNREVKRYHGPFSLVLMRRVLRSWNYGGLPDNCLFIRDAFERLKEALRSDPGYTKRLIKKYLIDNKHCAWTVITPDKKYLKDREAQEKKIAAALAKQTTKKQIADEAAALHQYQTSPEKDLACLPHIRPRDLKVIDDKIKAARADIKTRSGSVPLLKSVENTNGIAYIAAAFPLDVFEPQMYPYLSFFAYILNEVGWGDLRWDKTSLLIAKTCGGFSTTALTASCPKTAGARAMAKNNGAFAGRQWLLCKVKALDDKIDASVDLMRDCLKGARYDDKKRVRTLAEEVLNDLESSVVPNGHSFASGRAECRSNKSAAVEEIWSGASQIFTMRKILSDIDGTIEKMKLIASKVFGAGAVLHITADKATMPKALAAAKRFACDMELKAPAKKLAAPDKAFYDLTNIGKKSSACDETVSVSGMVGFAALSFRCSKYSTRQALAEKVLAHLLSSGALWEKIRTVGGAYGAFASADAIGQNFTLATYRDPSPQKSLAAFDECLEAAAKTLFDQESVEKAIAGTYSNLVQPKAPKQRGDAAFLRELYLVDSKEALAVKKMLLGITAADLQAAARRLLKFRRASSKGVLILPKNSAPKDSIEI